MSSHGSQTGSVATPTGAEAGIALSEYHDELHTLAVIATDLRLS